MQRGRRHGKPPAVLISIGLGPLDPRIIRRARPKCWWCLRRCGDGPPASCVASAGVGVGMSAVHVTEEAAPPRPGCARPVGCAVRLPLQVVTVRPVWRLGARRQARVPTPCPAAIPEPHHRLSLYCEAPGCTRVDLHATCGLVLHVAATPAQGPEARAGLRPADRAHSLSTASPAPPHAPHGQPVHL